MMISVYCPADLSAVSMGSLKTLLNDSDYPSKRVFAELAAGRDFGSETDPEILV